VLVDLYTVVYEKHSSISPLNRTTKSLDVCVRVMCCVVPRAVGKKYLVFSLQSYRTMHLFFRKKKNHASFVNDTPGREGHSGLNMWLFSVADYSLDRCLPAGSLTLSW
jgi:hypothetical protein